MRSVLFFLIVAGTVLVGACPAATAVVPGNATAYESTKDAQQLAPATEPLTPKVALVTFGPGRIYWERFGHNGLIVDDPAAGTRIVYNYGAFDFQEKHFLRNFALGHMRYSLIDEPLDADLATYVAEGRSVTVQLLNLTPAQARQLAAFLAWNAQPRNAAYRYDYFVNNCSTKVRDALNRVLGGVLERQLAHRLTAHTYRFDAVRLISPDFWLALGGDTVLGPNADRPLSAWQESFVPMLLSAALRDVVVSDPSGAAVPLVSDEELVLPARLPPAPAAPRDLRLPFLAAGLGLAALMLWLARAQGRPFRASFAVLAVTWWLICGFGGLLLAGLWGFTDHWAIWENENLLLLDPVCLLLPLVWWRAPRIARRLTTLVAAAALLSLIIRVLPGWYQSNLALIALTAPVHLVLAVLVCRQRSVAGIAARQETRLA